MILIWGSNYHGRVDRVPGFFYVQTKFFHMYYIPLIPTESWIVLEGTETGDGFQGVQTGFSLKSIATGWLRAAAVVGGIVAGIASLINGISWMNPAGMHEPEQQLLNFGFSVLGFVTCVSLFFLTRLWAKASYDRALLLAEEIGLDVDKCRDELEAALA